MGLYVNGLKSDANEAKLDTDIRIALIFLIAQSRHVASHALSLMILPTIWFSNFASYYGYARYGYARYGYARTDGNTIINSCAASLCLTPILRFLSNLPKADKWSTILTFEYFDVKKQYRG